MELGAEPHLIPQTCQHGKSRRLEEDEMMRREKTWWAVRDSNPRLPACKTAGEFFSHCPPISLNATDSANYNRSRSPADSLNISHFLDRLPAIFTAVTRVGSSVAIQEIISRQMLQAVGGAQLTAESPDCFLHPQ